MLIYYGDLANKSMCIILAVPILKNNKKDIAMTVQIGKKLLRESDADQRMDYISNKSNAFIWNDYGDEVEQWRRIAKKRSLPLVRVEHRENETTYYAYKDKSMLVPYLHEQGDNSIGVHVLGQLVEPDLELRLVVDTFGNSEYAFLPLTSSEWLLLEQQFGVSHVSSRFTPLGESVDELFGHAGQAFDLLMSQVVEIPSEASAAPHENLLKTLPGNWLVAADYTNLQNSDGSLRVERLASLLAGFAANSIHLFFSTEIFGQKISGIGLVVPKSEVLPTILPKFGCSAPKVRIFDDSFSRVVVLHSNFTACVWTRPNLE